MYNITILVARKKYNELMELYCPKIIVKQLIFYFILLAIKPKVRIKGFYHLSVVDGSAVVKS